MRKENQNGSVLFSRTTLHQGYLFTYVAASYHSHCVHAGYFVPERKGKESRRLLFFFTFFFFLLLTCLPKFSRIEKSILIPVRKKKKRCNSKKNISSFFFFLRAVFLYAPLLSKSISFSFFFFLSYDLFFIPKRSTTVGSNP